VLVAACIKQDQAAWATLVDRYGGLVYSIPTRYGLSRHDADDVFQEAFAALVAQLDTLRDGQSVAKWLITTAHRLAWRRIRQLRREVPPQYGSADANEPPPEMAERWERLHRVRLALEALDPRCRELLATLVGDHAPESYDQIAETLGIPRGSIGPTRARCLRKLLERLGETESTE